MQFESPVVLGAQQNPQAAVIWLHGLGADGYDFEPVVPELQIPHKERVRFIFPHANVRPVTLNGGLSCRAWFDIYSLSRLGNEDLDGMNETNTYIHSLIEQQLADGVASEHIILVGFSQGGAMALYSGLTYDKPLGGIMGLSTVLAGSFVLDKKRHSANFKTPIFLAHGRQDTVLPFEFGERSRDALQQLGYNVEWHPYDMAHTLCAQELVAMSQFLQDKI